MKQSNYSSFKRRQFHRVFVSSWLKFPLAAVEKFFMKNSTDAVCFVSSDPPKSFRNIFLFLDWNIFIIPRKLFYFHHHRCLKGSTKNRLKKTFHWIFPIFLFPPIANHVKILLNWFIFIPQVNISIFLSFRKWMKEGKKSRQHHELLCIKCVNYGFRIFFLSRQSIGNKKKGKMRKEKDSLANLLKRLSIVHRDFISLSLPFTASSFHFFHLLGKAHLSMKSDANKERHKMFLILP